MRLPSADWMAPRFLVICILMAVLEVVLMLTYASMLVIFAMGGVLILAWTALFFYWLLHG